MAQASIVNGATVTDDTITLSWSQPDEVSGFTILLFINASPEPPREISIPDGSLREYTITGVPPGSYNILLQTITLQQDVFNSQAYFGISVSDIPPSVVTADFSSGLIDGSIVLTWTQSRDISGFKILLTNESTGLTTETSVSSASRTYTLSAVPFGTYNIILQTISVYETIVDSERIYGIAIVDPVTASIVTAEVVDDTSIAVGWTQTQTVSAFKILLYKEGASDGPVEIGLSGSLRNHTITNVALGNYTIVLETTSLGGNTYTSDAIYVAVVDPTVASSIVRCEVLNGDSIALEWVQDRTVSSFTILLFDVATNNVTQIPLSGVTRAFTITGIPAAIYNIILQTTSLYQNTYSSTTLLSVPISNLAVSTSITRYEAINNNIILEWSSEDTTISEITILLTNVTKNNEREIVLPLDSSTYTITGLYDGVYIVELQTTNAFVTKHKSAGVSITLVDPAVASVITSCQVLSNTIKLDWIQNETVAGFNILLFDPANNVIATGVGPVPRTYTLQGIQPGTYNIILQTTTIYGNTLNSDIFYGVTVIQQIPEPVTNITTTPLEDIPTTYQTTVSWTYSPGDGFEDYRVSYSERSSDGTPLNERVINTPTPSVTIAVPHPNSTLFVSIVPDYEYGPSGPATTASFSIPDYTVPQITDITLTTLNADHIRFEWAYARDPIVGFFVELRDSITDNVVSYLSVDRAARSTKIEDIPVGSYYIHVHAVDYGGSFSTSSMFPNPISIPDPIAPIILLVNVEYGDGVDLTWERNTVRGTFIINVLDNTGTQFGDPIVVDSVNYSGSLTIRDLPVGVYGFQPEIILPSEVRLTGVPYEGNGITGIGPTPVITNVTANGYVVTLTWDQDFATLFDINIFGYIDGNKNSSLLEKLSISDDGGPGRTHSFELTEAGMYYFTIDAIILDGMTDTSKTYSSQKSTDISVPGGGGGGGGGGGNNGGNGHNMATLEFSYDGYTGSVSQTNTITVLGEEGGALTKDETITVHVTPEELSKVLAYSSNWTTSGDAAGEQPRPDVKFRPVAAVGAKLDAMFAQLKALGDGPAGSGGRTWTDDATASHPVFGDHLLGLTFTASALDDDELPRESIRKIEEGPITADELTTVVSDLDSTAVGAPKALLEGLFEQAVSASKVSTADGDHPDETGYKKPTFAAGDSLSFLVKYDFSKTRVYALDGEVAGTNVTTGARRTILIGSDSFNIDGGEETSDAFDRVYEIKLLAVAPA